MMQGIVFRRPQAVAAALLVAPLCLALPAGAQNALSGSTVPDAMPGAAVQNLGPEAAPDAMPAAGAEEAAPGKATQSAGAFIGKLGMQGLQMLGPSVPPAERAARFRQLFANDFDLPGISRFVLGPHGRQLSPAARQEFQDVFREFIVQSYSAKLGQYGGAPFRVTGERPAGDETIVSSQVVAQGKPVAIDWHVINRDGRFAITDVGVDGVSVRAAQRDEFARIIERNGGRPEALVTVLRQQLAQVR